MSQENENEFETTGVPGDAVPQRLEKELREERESLGESADGDEADGDEADGDEADEDENEEDENEEDEVEDQGADDEEE